MIFNMKVPTTAPSNVPFEATRVCHTTSSSTSTPSRAPPAVTTTSILATSSSTRTPALPKYVVFATSGLGGCLGWAVVHPFNTIAVRANLASASGQTFSLSQMMKNQGFWSLYDGLSAGLARQIFYATSRLGLFEIFRDRLHAYRGKTDFAARYVALRYVVCYRGSKNNIRDSGKSSPIFSSGYFFLFLCVMVGNV